MGAVAAADWGDVPTWVSAGSGLLALAFAALAALAGYRLYLVESQRDRDAEKAREETRREARRAQATLVSAWRAPDTPGPPPGALVRNASEAPVYEVVVTYLDYRAAWIGSEPFGLVPPDREPVVIKLATTGTIVGDPLPGFTADTKRSARVSVDFTDAAGVRWRRDERGALTDFDPDNPPDHRRAVEFEARGQRWRRDENWRLQP
jgi:hypothetical protein